MTETVYDYAICSAIFLLGVVLLYFNKQQFRNLQNRLFSFVLILALVDIVIDIASSLILGYTDVIPLWLLYLILTIYFALQSVFALLMVLYSLTVVGALTTRNYKKFWPLLIPALLTTLVLLLNIFKPLIFSFDGPEYKRHILWYFLFISAGVYTVITILIAFRYKKHIRRSYFFVILGFVLFTTAALIIQVFKPYILLTPLAITLSVCSIYLIMNKPENMLDTLTGAFNREALMLTLQNDIISQEPFQAMLIKINDIGRTNNVFGYLIGNDLLIAVVKYLMARTHQCTYRLISNQFVIVTRNPAEFEQLQFEIKGRFTQPWRIADMTMVVSISAVCMSDTGSIKSPEELLRLMETMIRTVEPGETLELDAKVLANINRRSAIEEALREALDKDALEVYYQPVFYCREGSFLSAEALVRFNHETMGFIPPDEFIPIAEQNGLIFRVDELVTRHVCRFIRDNDLKDKYGLRQIEVNLSVAEFVQKELPEKINDIINHYEVDHEMMLFEITETATTMQFELLKDSMHTLRDRGYNFALDDYGTGYANISKIMRLPFKCIKIDRSMLTASEESVNSQIMLYHTIEMLHEMGFETIVEGVETSDQRVTICTLGVNGIQGYYFARPMPEEQFLEFLKEHRK